MKTAFILAALVGKNAAASGRFNDEPEPEKFHPTALVPRTTSGRREIDWKAFIRDNPDDEGKFQALNIPPHISSIYRPQFSRSAPGTLALVPASHRRSFPNLETQRSVFLQERSISSREENLTEWASCETFERIGANAQLVRMLYEHALPKGLPFTVTLLMAAINCGFQAPLAEQLLYFIRQQLKEDASIYSRDQWKSLPNEDSHSRAVRILQLLGFNDNEATMMASSVDSYDVGGLADLAFQGALYFATVAFAMANPPALPYALDVSNDKNKIVKEKKKSALKAVEVIPDAVVIPTFDFQAVSAGSKYCANEKDAVTHVQSMLASYGLGYALLLAHRLDQCLQTTLVKSLHDDLYKWIDGQRLLTNGSPNLEIFSSLKLEEPNQSQVRLLKAKPTTLQFCEVAEQIAIHEVQAL